MSLPFKFNARPPRPSIRLNSSRLWYDLLCFLLNSSQSDAAIRVVLVSSVVCTAVDGASSGSSISSRPRTGGLADCLAVVALALVALCEPGVFVVETCGAAEDAVVSASCVTVLGSVDGLLDEVVCTVRVLAVASSDGVLVVSSATVGKVLGCLIAVASVLVLVA